MYRYHAAYRRRRDADKYARLATFGAALPRIRRAVERDLRRPSLDREKVLALVVRLLDLTHMRVGGEAYATANRSFGMTTLRRRHARVDGGSVTFRFRGKAGRTHRLRVADRRLARLVARCQDLPGQTLFTWLDDEDQPHRVTSDDVNEHLRRISGADVTARDFRTWAGTLLAVRALRAAGAPGADRERASQVAGAMDAVAEGLGNTRAVARASYVHPDVIHAWGRGRLPPARMATGPEDPPTPAEERELLRLLRR